NYAEVVKVTYNANILTTETLLKSYFESHDPTQKNRQGNDIGTQYRSTILFSELDQKNVAIKLKATYQALLAKNGYGKIQTNIKPLDKFYSAEEYHQNYLV
ncbi:peptide methionine sulfoxide reductase, partial [Pseudoalteromonas ruthenica]